MSGSAQPICDSVTICCASASTSMGVPDHSPEMSGYPLRLLTISMAVSSETGATRSEMSFIKP